MITKEDIEQLKPFQARAIIEGLRKGIVPTEYVSFFTVGRQNWLKFVEEDLDYFIANGGGKVRFINGDYGDGKTHFMSVVQQLAPLDKTNHLRKLKILIAEDDEVSEMLIDITVKMFSKEIFKVRTGVEAVEICRENPTIDLVLMDIQLPEMGGYEATQQIREFNKDVVIIAQTAYGLTGDREKAIESGCNDYISKPIKKDELLALIQKYFGK